jgi:protein phosphatase
MPEESLFVVADGMGGHAAGDVASQLAVDTIAQAFRSKTFAGTARADRPSRGDELVRAIEMANAAVFTQANANEAQLGMGTTIVAARFSTNKQRMYVGHVGDSRCYRVRQGELTLLTRDHTLRAMLNLTGPDADTLVRAVGIQEEVEVDLLTESPQPSDCFLLCSDGLPRMVPDATILEIIQREPDLDVACQQLITAANERGGRDNITVILIRVQGTPELRMMSGVPPAVTPA